MVRRAQGCEVGRGKVSQPLHAEYGDLFIGIRKEYINIYFQGCSLFKISYKEELLFETHYKYLVRPKLKNPYVSWVDDRPARDRVNEILIDSFDLDSLKKSSSWYAEAEKEGVLYKEQWAGH